MGRAAAMPKLTNADDDYLSSIEDTDNRRLRSVDERQLSRTDWRSKPGGHPSRS
jgi:hypothetical protein